MPDPLDIKQIDALIAGATRGPLRVTCNPSNPDGSTPIEPMIECAKFAGGPLWGVMVPDHPETIGGWTDAPEYAVMTCYTGNGPTSEGNARLYAAAPDLALTARDALAEVERLRGVIGEIANAVDDARNAGGVGDGLARKIAADLRAVITPDEQARAVVAAALRARGGSRG